MSIRILLADDHRIVHDSLKPLLDKQADMEVVAVAENGRISSEIDTGSETRCGYYRHYYA